MHYGYNLFFAPFEYFKKRTSQVALIIVLATVLYYSYENRIKDNAWSYAINSDGKGYYSYLPATFIYGDWNWDFVFEHEIKICQGYPNAVGDYIFVHNGEKVNRYFVGTSILMMPFFLLALFLSYLFGYPPDGYSILFCYSIIIAAIAYFILGLNYLRKTLLLFNLSELTVGVIILSFGLGTNLFYYTYYEPSMSHVYSFALIAIFCFNAKRIAIKYSNKLFLFLAFTTALILVIRPTNLIILLSLPFFFEKWGDFSTFIKKVFNNYKTLIMGVVIIFTIASLQIATYYLQAGKFWVYSYNDAVFNFTDPHFLEVLFGYRKGLFVYTPICFISLLAIIFYYKTNKFQLIGWLLFFVINTYILSSWSFWWYGMSYGLRVFIDFLPLFAIPLALLYNRIKQVGSKIILSFVLASLIGINFIQMYQYQNYILHWESMNKESYWKVFLKTDKKYAGYLWTKKYHYDKQQIVKTDYKKTQIVIKENAWGEILLATKTNASKNFNLLHIKTIITENKGNPFVYVNVLDSSGNSLSWLQQPVFRGIEQHLFYNEKTIGEANYYFEINLPQNYDKMQVGFKTDKGQFTLEGYIINFIEL